MINLELRGVYPGACHSGRDSDIPLECTALGCCVFAFGVWISAFQSKAVISETKEFHNAS